MRKIISSPARIEGIVATPGDRSISHRAALLNSIAMGKSHISNFCVGDDRKSMLRCLRALGVRVIKHSLCPVTQAEECFLVYGRGPNGLKEPSSVLNAGNSGTTIRLISGLLAAQPFFSVITGDTSLRKRPMKRIVEPLRQMGATVSGRSDNSLVPLAIQGGGLHGIDYQLPLASAQVKSCLLIAGLHAQGTTSINQPSITRDHTELMMESMGANIHVEGLTVTVSPSEMFCRNVRVPGDISAAAFWLVAACCHPKAKIRIREVGINPSRTGILDALISMGARISIENVHNDGREPVADLVAESSQLKAIQISGDLIPRLIDELPVIALAACFAEGETVIRDAQEMRTKESDRIQATVVGLRNLGARIEELSDGMVIQGGECLTGAQCQSFGDHRIAMTLGIAGLLAQGETTLVGGDASGVSYTGFWDTLQEIQRTQE